MPAPKTDQGNPLFDPKTDNQPIDAQVQQNLNQPTVDPTGVSDEDQAFLNEIVAKIDGGQIDIHKPSTLLNMDVYGKLTEEQQGQVDMEAMNMLPKIREISDLHKAGFQQTFQIQNLVHAVRLKKEEFEKTLGDVFII